MLSLKGDRSNWTRVRGMNFSSMPIASCFQLSVGDTWCDETIHAQTGTCYKCERMSELVLLLFAIRGGKCPKVSPEANRTGLTGETCPLLQLSRAAYRTEPQRQTSLQSSTPSETSGGPPSGTGTKKRRYSLMSYRFIFFPPHS